jgi:hypothetical protein
MMEQWRIHDEYSINTSERMSGTSQRIPPSQNGIHDWLPHSQFFIKNIFPTVLQASENSETYNTV